MGECGFLALKGQASYDSYDDTQTSDLHCQTLDEFSNAFAKLILHLSAQSEVQQIQQMINEFGFQIWGVIRASLRMSELSHTFVTYV